MLRFRTHHLGLVLLVTYALVLQGVLWAQALGQTAGQIASQTSVFCSSSALANAPPASHTPPATIDHDCCLIGCMAGGLALAAGLVADAHVSFAKTNAAFGQVSAITASLRSLHRARAPPAMA